MAAPLECKYEPEWRSKSMAERLAFVYTNKLFTDVTLGVFLGGKQHVFMAHKNILAHSSLVLEDMFYGNDSRGSAYTELKGIDPQGLSYVLKVLYHVPPSPRKDIDRTILLSAYHAASSLGIHRIEADLRQEILDGVLNNSLVTRDDFWKMLELARVLKLGDIKDSLLRFAESNAKAVLRAKSLAKASPNTLREVMDLDMLRIPEGEVLDAVIRWKRSNGDLPFADEISRDLLGLVRFRNLSTLDLCQFVASKTELVSRDDVLKIMMHLGSPTSAPLPEWCSTKFRCSVVSLTRDTKNARQSSQLSDDSKKLTFKIVRSSNILVMYLEQKYTDVCFVVGRKRRQIKAHRNILAIGSIVFEKMFFSPVADTRTVIDVPGHDPRGFENMLMYFYDDTKPESLFKKSDIIGRLFSAAEKYGSCKLKNACLKFYTPVKINSHTFWRNLQSAIGNPKVLGQFLDYASKETRGVLSCPDFLDASLDAVVRVLQLDTLAVKEIEILDGAAKWLARNSGPGQSKYDILGHVRFGDIAAEEFCLFTTDHGDLLPQDDVFHILFHLHNKESPLPKWCYRGSPRQSALPLPYVCE